MNPRRAGLAWLVSATLASGCGIADGTAQPMTDPTEILEEGFSSTASLTTAHARFALEATGAREGLGGASGEIDLDFEEYELAGTVALPRLLGGRAMSVLYANRELYMRPGSGPWELVGGDGEADPLAFLPTLAKVADALDAALDEPEVAATLVGTEPCVPESCYHVVVDVPADAVWLTFQRLQGLEGLDEPMPAAIPPVELEAWVERAELRLVRLRGSFVDPDGSSLTIEVELSDHDAAVDVSPPPSSEVLPDG